ncbi:amino acid permease [Flavobacterium sp.]|uniref:APC family permease n=1 Tax=Flavobacterium sp. TaxID=239 RepID=UPI00286E334D|nr:amino acid permease [Flavobacterium sp.]
MPNNSQNLSRTLGLSSVIVIVVSNVLGSGVYKKVAPMASELNSSAWVVIAWIVGGIITLFGALCNAEIAGLLSDTGGEYNYYKKIYNKFFAFIFGWSLFAVIQTAAIASVAYVFGQSLNNLLSLPLLFPTLQKFSIAGVFFPFENFSVKFITILIIIFLSWVNSKGVKSSANFSNFLLGLIVLGIGLIIIFGLGSPQSIVEQSFELNTKENSVTISSFFTAMLAAFWAYQGWASIGYIGGEVKNPKINIPKGITIGVIIVIVIYVVVNITYLSILSIPELNSINASGNQIAAVTVMEKIWGNFGVVFISILVLLTTFGCTHVTILASSRTYYAMAKENLFFPSVAKLNKNQAPGSSLLYQCVWACILVLSGSFDQLTDMTIFAIFIYYGSTAFGVFILRKKLPDAERPYKVWGYPIVPVIFILFCIVFFGNTILTRPREAIFGMILMLTGIPMYWWFNKKNRN